MRGLNLFLLWWLKGEGYLESRNSAVTSGWEKEGTALELQVCVEFGWRREKGMERLSKDTVRRKTKMPLPSRDFPIPLKE
jgi:hypothetical protein